MDWENEKPTESLRSTGQALRRGYRAQTGEKQKERREIGVSCLSSCFGLSFLYFHGATFWNALQKHYVASVWSVFGPPPPLLLLAQFFGETFM